VDDNHKYGIIVKNGPDETFHRDLPAANKIIWTFPKIPVILCLKMPLPLVDAADSEETAARGFFSTTSDKLFQSNEDELAKVKNSLPLDGGGFGWWW
jgi:hypothetical protein